MPGCMNNIIEKVLKFYMEHFIWAGSPRDINKALGPGPQQPKKYDDNGHLHRGHQIPNDCT